MLDNNQLRQQILPMLETAGLITQEQDLADKRKMLIYPVLPQHISPTPMEAGNSEARGGVETGDTRDNDIVGGDISL